MTNNFATVQQALEQGVEAHQAGRLADAEQAYRAALGAAPGPAESGHGEALYLLGMLQVQRGLPAEGEQLLAKAMAASPGEPMPHYQHGIALAALKRFADAVASFDRAIALRPDFAEAFDDRGVALGSLGRHQDAVASFERATALDPGQAAAHFHSGIALMSLRRPADAISSFDRVIALKPDHAETWFLRGKARLELRQIEAAIAECDHMIAHHEARAELFLLRANALFAGKRFEDAVADCDRAIALRPDLAEAFVNRGNAHFACRRLVPALADYDRAIALKPDLAEAFFNRGNAYCADQRFASALGDYDRAIALKPDFAEAFFNRGNAHGAEQRFAPALADYDRAIALHPSFTQAYWNRARTLTAIGRAAEAIADCDRAIALAPDSAEAFAERAHLLAAEGRHAEAVTDYRAAIGLSPDLDYVQSGYLNAKMHMCDWSDFDADCATLFSHVAGGKTLEAPFTLLFVGSSAQLQRQCAERYVADKYPPVPPLWNGAIYRHPKIRLGYLSSQTFREHPVTNLMGGLFARHNKERFETTGLAFGPNDRSAVRRQMESAFDRFLDVAERSDQDIAERIRSLEIDILVDLDGFTEGARAGILARRPAPVQVNHLGYASTMGAPFIDYILADPVLIGAGDERHYAEKIVLLPDTYQPNSNRPPPAALPARAGLGLPEKGFVFCCFNAQYKITPGIFDIWMRLLNQVPGSVLWLLMTHEAARTNLGREAARRGVDPQRLVFAPFAAQPEHLARLQAADLFLDTLYYNAHTTASDALWMGLPLVTCRGETFASRVAASLLRAAGMPELVTESLADYETLALRLAREPGLLRIFRERLAQNRATSALFDSDRFLRNLETAYARMAEIAGRGEPARAFEI